MKKNIVSITFGFIIVVAIGGLVLWQKNSASEPLAHVVSPVSSGAKETNKEIQKMASIFTPAQVAEHNSRTSCWSIINGSVYDLTSWIPNHPGGERAILQLCGIDGSEQYNGKHGNARRPAAILAGFKIGILAQ